MNSFTDLEVWKKARILRNNISELTKSFPPDEKYRLTDQIIRSSRSVGNNIAEGHGRFHYADAAKFLLNARGSAAETIDHLIIALDSNFINEEILDSFKNDCEECMKMINGYISFLRKQAEVKPNL
ncbi:four helix bundle protein [Mucilaginibacter sp. BJC16-A38]|uniref:four helix bundle protein n=1 Tax=Mucilaginibacter phenanthrenivorans TaxID=1234842 RepID=UPI0021580A99|nr:four helix bundle protein [Mucilaginibacter phenanthrenivorans]MCR8561655.1 four helix bundle protein [Mucilaginibacter phenanthrenivorans]